MSAAAADHEIGHARGGTVAIEAAALSACEGIGHLREMIFGPVVAEDVLRNHGHIRLIGLKPPRKRSVGEVLGPDEENLLVVRSLKADASDDLGVAAVVDYVDLDHFLERGRQDGEARLDFEVRSIAEEGSESNRQASDGGRHGDTGGKDGEDFSGAHGFSVDRTEALPGCLPNPSATT